MKKFKILVISGKSVRLGGFPLSIRHLIGKF